MTEAAWLACEDPNSLLDFRHPTQDDADSIRRLRLLACACCRLLWVEIPSDAAELLALAERHADGKLKNGKEKLPSKTSQLSGIDARFRAVQSAAFRYDRVDLLREAIRNAQDIVVWEAREARFGHLHDWEQNELPYEAYQQVMGPAKAAIRAAQMAILRDIFGNPFRPVTFAPEWRTDTARALAQQMYESRDFSAMPILADALQDAGCDSADILNHCRGPGLHVRGCWCIDAVLGKQ
jgi:hypothetical protein